MLGAGARAMIKTNDTPQNHIKICRAKTRAGAPCQKYPIAGRTRCRLHGGLSTGQKRQRVKQLALQRIGSTDDGPRLLLRRESRYGQSYGA